MSAGRGGDARRLVVLSNRLPYNLPREPGGKWPKRNVGGLVNAVEPVVVATGGCWVGWDGNALPSAAAVAAALDSGQGVRAPTGVELHGVPLAQREVARYYHGFSNRALWPLFHDFPGRSVFRPEHYEAYEAVNRRFAEIVFSRTRGEGRVWVHDYHLMLVPRLLREMGHRGRIDFFLHIPFPPPEIFLTLPSREPILRGVLASDTVAFHVDAYRDNFAASAKRLLGVTVDAGESPGCLVLRTDGARARPTTEPAERSADDERPPSGTRRSKASGGPSLAADEGAATTARGEPEVRDAATERSRATLAHAAPIGIDVADFERIAALPKVEAQARGLRRAFGGSRILFGADRLDYTKGIRERLDAVERYLADRPDAAGWVVLVQIVVPSRHQVKEYRLMKREIDREVGRINGKYGRQGWVPIHYRYAALDREELVAHYRAADVALITPLRDGMNLVAPEFAASRIDLDGVLIVSEFAGVAERSPGAIRVNPNDVEGCAAAIHQALTMPREERRARMAMLREAVGSNPLSSWVRRCLDTPLPAAQGEARASTLLPARSPEAVSPLET